MGDCDSDSAAEKSREQTDEAAAAQAPRALSHSAASAPELRSTEATST